MFENKKQQNQKKVVLRVQLSSFPSSEKGNRGVTSMNHILSCLLPAVKNCVTQGSTTLLGNKHLISQQQRTHLLSRK